MFTLTRRLSLSVSALIMTLPLAAAEEACTIHIVVDDASVPENANETCVAVDENGDRIEVPCAPPEQVACSAGATVILSLPISADEMASGSGDDSGPGRCTSSVTFSDDLTATVNEGAGLGNGTWEQVDYNGRTTECDAVHCGTVIFGDGHEEAEFCSLLAFCDPETGLATALGYTW
jgi:hypothetical protein